MKKIAIPTRSDQVDEHFGHCEYYTIITFDEKNNEKERVVLESPAGCGCKSNIAGTLSQLGVSTMLAGNIGAGARNVMAHSGIEVLGGFSGDINNAVSLWLKGDLENTDLTCSEHEHHHEHGHHGDHECHHHGNE